MKGEFVSKFIKGVVNAGKDFHEIYNWTPIYYKGFLVSGRDHRKIYSGFKNLEHRKIIKKVNNGKFEFTQKGKIWFKSSLLRHYKELGIKWDGKWRVVIFDIPQELHNKRNRFRKRLKLLGFYMVQKSVFAFPYPCEGELAGYCIELDISDYVNIISAENLGFINEEVKKFFQI